MGGFSPSSILGTPTSFRSSKSYRLSAIADKRYDLYLGEKADEFLRELITYSDTDRVSSGISEEEINGQHPDSIFDKKSPRGLRVLAVARGVLSWLSYDFGDLPHHIDS